MKKIFPILIFILVLFLPAIASACPLCQGGQGYSKASISAYKATTAFLLLLPIIGGGGIFYWIYSRKREQ